jgi:hypothetical protein
MNSVSDLYQKYFRDIQFERSALFKAIREKYHCTTVLYPGSSIHITTSFYFPHVVYVDTSELAQQFFSHHEDILDLIKNQKKYKESSYVRFINQDFTTTLSLRDHSFDLVIALFAGGISCACKKYLKIGGILLTNNHHNDASEAALDDEYQLIARVIRKGDAYKISEMNEDNIPPESSSSNKRYLKRSNSGLVYTDNEDYFLFKKIIRNVAKF